MLHVHISMFYVLVKLFHKKLILFVSCVKKIKFGAKNISYWDNSWFFPQNINMYVRNFWSNILKYFL
jgi:hypothetical protein